MVLILAKHYKRDANKYAKTKKVSSDDISAFNKLYFNNYKDIKKVGRKNFKRHLY